MLPQVAAWCAMDISSDGALSPPKTSCSIFGQFGWLKPLVPALPSQSSQTSQTSPSWVSTLTFSHPDFGCLHLHTQAALRPTCLQLISVLL